jgi:site-specific recombinase XerD
MATIKVFIRTSRKNGLAYVRYRLSDRKSHRRYLQLFYKSRIQVEIQSWDAKHERIKPNSIVHEKGLDEHISELKFQIIHIYNSIPEKASLTSCKFQSAIDNVVLANDERRSKTLVEYFEEYLSKVELSAGTIRQCRIVLNNIIHYQDKCDYNLFLDNMDANVIINFQKFLFDDLGLSENTVTKRISRLRTFFNWCFSNNYTQNYPFAKSRTDQHNFHLTKELYGTPIFLTLEERDALYEFDLSDHPSLETQRDIFILQSCLGCRVGDYYQLTSDNIIVNDEYADGAIQYIPAKTSRTREDTIYVPLIPLAHKILNKYKHEKGKPLMPFISVGHYNESIRNVMKIAGINRNVPFLNRETGKMETRPIYEVASSHMARRIFVGNLYSKIKDPSIISKMSGHVEGSRSFARYRSIDAQVLCETIKLLE